MMYKIIFYILGLFSLNFHLVENKFIELNETNHIAIKGKIDETLITQNLLDLNNLKGDTWYIYIQSGGGSVIDGLGLIEQIKFYQENNKKIVCVVEYAFSMAFVILQYCDTRYGLSSAITMQHQMSLGLKGPILNLNNKLKYVQKMSEHLDEHQAKRLGISIKSFNDKVANDWWIYGKDNIEYNIIDEIVQVGCNKKLLNTTYNVTEYTFFGTIEFTYSRCPMIKNFIHRSFKKYDETEEKIFFNTKETQIKFDDYGNKFPNVNF